MLTIGKCFNRHSAGSRTRNPRVQLHTTSGKPFARAFSCSEARGQACITRPMSNYIAVSCCRYLLEYLAVLSERRRRRPNNAVARTSPATEEAARSRRYPTEKKARATEQQQQFAFTTPAAIIETVHCHFQVRLAGKHRP